MTTLTVGLGQTGTINASGTYDVILNALSSLIVTGGTSTIGPVVVMDSLASVANTITITNASLKLASGVSVSVADTFVVGADGTLDLTNAGGLGLATIVDFSGTGSHTLVLDGTGPVSLLSTVKDLTGNVTLDIRSGIATHASYNSLTHVMSFIDAGGTTIETLTLGAGSDTNAAHYHFADNGAGGSIVVACFLAGTRIATPAGEALVELLRVGDLVRTQSGRNRPIRWIGRRAYAGRFAAGAVMPIRIAAGALGNNLPRRDLYVSPRHAMLLDGALVPAEALVDGIRITACRDVPMIEYVHIELDTHDILLAEGAPTESYLDCGNRSMFQNFDPDAAESAPPALPCAPVVDEGPRLDAIRARLASTRLAPARAHPPGPLRGHVEQMSDGLVVGWVLDASNPTHPVDLELCRDGTVLARTRANLYRSDLDKAGLAAGRCGFRIALPDPRTVTVRRASDGATLGLADELTRAMAA